MRNVGKTLGALVLAASLASSITWSGSAFAFHGGMGGFHGGGFHGGGFNAGGFHGGFQGFHGGFQGFQGSSQALHGGFQAFHNGSQAFHGTQALNGGFQAFHGGSQAFNGGLVNPGFRGSTFGHRGFHRFGFFHHHRFRRFAFVPGFGYWDYPYCDPNYDPYSCSYYGTYY